MTKEVDRSSKTGRFVTEHYRKTHPNTTEHERIRTPAKAPTPSTKRK